jgi:hypothetical protein
MNDLDVERCTQEGVGPADPCEELTRYLADTVPLKHEERDQILLWWKVRKRDLDFLCCLPGEDSAIIEPILFLRAWHATTSQYQRRRFPPNVFSLARASLRVTSTARVRYLTTSVDSRWPSTGTRPNVVRRSERWRRDDDGTATASDFLVSFNQLIRNPPTNIPSTPMTCIAT